MGSFIMGSPHEQNLLETYVPQALSKVSRSFALVIPSLEKPLDHIVGLAYLICRVCDNIEDCIKPLAWKQERWEEFSQLMTQPTQAPTILREWGKYEWPGLTPAEQELMGHPGEPLWDMFAALSEQTRESIGRWVSEMAEGMAWMLSDRAPIQTHHGIAVLRDRAAYDNYCYYVAGTVGHLCTALTAEFYGWDKSTTITLEQHATAFGRALQKTNILKDFAKDLQREVSYIPAEWLAREDYQPLQYKGAKPAWAKLVIENIMHELAQSMDYIHTLPLSAEGYRRFCLRAVLPAYETMLHAATFVDTLFTQEHNCKISKDAMIRCLEQTEVVVQDNEALRATQTNYEKTISHLLQQA
ncbi:MAG: hypothetical protein EP343_29130 [Deltaproteobacteria bacterium]|nr:MAG: hypothetical protein EP343_29130 [Deltaproteobacteria bacterium]